MKTRAEWVEIIVKDNEQGERQIARMHKRLFMDLEETIEFLAGWFLCTFELYKLPSNDTHAKHSLESQLKKQLYAIRSKYLGLSLDHSRTAALHIAKNWDIFFTALVLFGSAPREVEHAVRAMERLLEICESMYGIPEHEKDHQLSLGMLIGLFATSHKNNYTWENVMWYMHNSGDTSILYRIAGCISHDQVGLMSVPLSRWVPGQLPFVNHENIPTFLIPTPDELLDWLNIELVKLNNHFRQQAEKVEKLVRRLRRNFTRYSSRYEDMWLDMLVHPRHALRPDGLDRVIIKHDIMRELGYQSLVLLPESEFPNFRARYHASWHGAPHCLELVFNPSDLSLINIGNLPETDIRVWMDRLLAYLAVFCMWRIVMGKVPVENIGTSRKGGDRSAIVRPHFRKLAEGRKMSPEARKRALAEFRTEPLPGFTFVRGYQRGDEPQSGEPLFSLNEEDLKP